MHAQRQLREAAEPDDASGRALLGFELGVEFVVAAIERIAADRQLTSLLAGTAMQQSTAEGGKPPGSADHTGALVPDDHPRLE